MPSVVLISLMLSESSSVMANNLNHEQGQKLCLSAEKVVLHVMAKSLLAKYTMSRHLPEYPTLPEEDNSGTSKGIDQDSKFWSVGWLGQAPSRQIVRRWLSSEYSSAFACDNNIVDANASKSKPEADQLVSSRKQIIQSTIPVLSEDKRESMFLFSSAGPGLAGTVEFILAKNTRKGWVLAGRRILYVS
jgi:hypothetical protein